MRTTELAGGHVGASRESEKQYRHLFELNPNPMWICDESTLRFMAVNEAAINLYGWSRTEFLGMTIENVRPPEDVPKLRAMLDSYRGSRAVFAGEWRHRKKDGTVFDVAVTVSCLQFQGRDAHLAMVNDITERKRAEVALLESQRQLKDDLEATKRLAELGVLFARQGDLKPVLTEVIDTAIAICDADFGNIQLLDCDSGALKIVAQRGFPKWWVEFWNTIYKGKGTCGTALVNRKRVIVADIERSPIFAGTRALEVNLKVGVRAVQSTPLLSRAGKTLGMFSTHYKIPQRPDERALRLLDLLANQASDLIERSQSERVIREGAERLALAASGSRIGMFEWHLPTGKMQWTEQQSHLLGLQTTRRKLITTTTPLRLLEYRYRDWAKCVHREDLPRVEKELRRCMTAQAPFESEYRVMWRDRSVHWIASRGVFQHDGQKRPQRFSGIIMDVTAAKLAQEQSHQLNTTLERRVATRTEELTRVNELLTASEQSLADFFSEAPIGLLWLGPGGRIMRTNQAQAALLGYPIEKLKGRYLAEFCIDREAVVLMIRTLARKESVHERPLTFFRPDFAIRHVLIDANAARQKGQLTYSRWFVRDVSQRVKLEKEILAVGEQVRRQIGHDLHDDLCQQLTSIEYLGRALERRLSASYELEAARAREITVLTRRTINYTRELSHMMAPMELSSNGLPHALKDLAAQTKKLFRIECRFRGDSRASVNDGIAQINLYRVAQEAIQNAIKHGKARHVVITLAANGDNILLRVQDDGVGFASKPRNNGVGLRIMEYRANALGGSLMVKESKGGGAAVLCSVPNIHSKPTDQGLLCPQRL